MIKRIDKLIDKLSMYRLLIYYLLFLIGAAFILSLFRILTYNPFSILIFSAIAVFACWIINKILGSIFDIPIAYESSIITGLILSLIITPTLGLYNILFILAASGLAMGSKYILTFRKKHIFNPAAIAVVLTAFGPHQTASWWVGSATLLPFILIGGFLIIRKINKGKMLLVYLASTTISTIFFSLISKVGLSSSLHDMVFSSAVFFLGFVMLTEPITSPVRERSQYIYAGIVGFLLPPQVHLLSFYTTPEISLIIGNIYAFFVNPKVKIIPVLKKKERLNEDSLDLIFNPIKPFAYLPGQYMEWTIEHNNTDSRGNRRYFTLSSSPTEEDISIGVKFSNRGSSFKEALLQVDRNSLISASQLGGDFVLPENSRQKLVFIAGGIGITPYRSMLKYLIDKRDKRDIILFYAVNKLENIAYQDILKEAKRYLDLKIYFILPERNKSSNNPNILYGYLKDKDIESIVTDYKDRHFYISGPNTLVSSIKRELLKIDVPRKNIVTDLFSGYN